MAYVGMKYPVAVALKEVKGGKAVYVNDKTGGDADGEGFVIGKAINFTGTPNKNDVTLYADDATAETDKTQRNWSVSLNVDDLTLKVRADLLGHKYEKVESFEGMDGMSGVTNAEKMTIGTDDVAPYFGTGFYKRRRKDNVTSYEVVWLYKVQYSEPTENAETKGESVNFQTPTMEGTAYPIELGEGENTKMVVGDKYSFTKEADARKFLEEMIKKKASEAA